VDRSNDLGLHVVRRRVFTQGVAFGVVVIAPALNVVLTLIS